MGGDGNGPGWFAALAGEFATAVETGDGELLASLFTADGVYHDGFYGPFRGRPAIARMVVEHFHGAAVDFVWDMRDPVTDGSVGYARYTFSYESTLPDARGRRVVFEGMSRFVLDGGLIAEYTEVFDAGAALRQLGFSPERISRFAAKTAERVRDAHRGSPHLPAVAD